MLICTEQTPARTTTRRCAALPLVGCVWWPRDRARSPRAVGDHRQNDRGHIPAGATHVPGGMPFIRLPKRTPSFYDKPPFWVAVHVRFESLLGCQIASELSRASGPTGWLHPRRESPPKGAAPRGHRAPPQHRRAGCMDRRRRARTPGAPAPPVLCVLPRSVPVGVAILDLEAPLRRWRSARLRSANVCRARGRRSMASSTATAGSRIQRTLAGAVTRSITTCGTGARARAQAGAAQTATSSAARSPMLPSTR